MFASIRTANNSWFPLLILSGEQGAAKSTTARLLRSLIDPNAAPLRSEPRDGRDLVIAASNRWLLALDNLSYLPDWLSDCLCRLVTGGGFATRELYMDAEETIFDSQRPVILTSIEDVADRGDLLDRAVILHLPSIPDEKRKTESAFWASADAVHPQILGCLLDAVSAGSKELAACPAGSPAPNGGLLHVGHGVRTGTRLANLLVPGRLRWQCRRRK
jgi:hypothetical protein